MAFKNFHIENKAGVGSVKIVGPIDWWDNNSADFIKLIDNLLAEGITDLDLYINSPGGSMDHANEIVNQLHRFGGNKTVTLGAMVCSSAFTISLSFEPEKTSCYKNTMGMYHDPSGYVRIQRMSDFESNRKLFEDLRNDVISRIAERTGLDKEEVSKRMEKTTWLNSGELKSQGFVATILDAKDKAPTGAKNSLKNMGFDLPTILNHVEETDDLFDNNFNTNQIEMKEIAQKLGLPENATADEIAKAIAALQNKAKFGEEALVNLAVSKGIKQDNAEKSVKNNFEGTLELVNGMETPAAPAAAPAEGEDPKGKPANSGKPAETRPSDLLNQLKQELGLGGGGAPANKKFEDMTLAEREALMDKDPAKFEQLYAESLGGSKNVKFD